MPPPGPAGRVVERLNLRFNKGFASNNLSEAGVLWHTFDNVDGESVRENLWLPCSETGYWCNGYEVASASLINRRLPHFFNEDGAGLILNPTALSPLSSSLRCAFAYDAGSMGTPDGCPGLRCDDDDSNDVYCHWMPWQLQDMLQQHEELDGSGNDRPCGQDYCDYNEVVIDNDFWADHLPGIIEAIAYPLGADDAEDKARDVYSSFREEFGSEVEDRIPLVTFDRSAAESPFDFVELPGR